MRIQVFDVEHGACSLVTADTGVHLLIDCGHNSTTNWRPSTYLPGQGIRDISRLFVTNYDEDHVSDLPNLRQEVRIGILHRNPTVTPAQLRELKSETGIGRGMISLCEMATAYGHPVISPPNLGPLTLASFHNRYPDDFDDENNLSLALFMHCHGLHIVFAGDLEEKGWLRLLQRDEFRSELRKVNVFVASHHGRASGYCAEVFAHCSPTIVIMSDKATMHDTQRESVPWYRQHCSGINYGGTHRRVFTTRRDGRILLDATPAGTTVDTTGH